MKHTVIIGIHFIDSEEIEHYCFQLCRRNEAGIMEAVAILDFRNESVWRIACTPALKARLKAIERLARMWKRRSTPARFC